MDPSLPPSESNIRIFRFTRVPFGITASPFLLAASIVYYLRRDPDSQLNKEIEESTYVDNILLGASTKEEAIPDSPVDYELCVFGDASKRLYASCVYLRCRSFSSTTTHLLMAKSLLGPRNPITMPRMELLATLISLRLVHFVHTQLRLNISAVHVFSDSQIVLHWIHSMRSLRTFVRNRIMEIRAFVDKFRDAHIPLRFYYVQSQYNPADCASRGIPTSHARHHIWWSGPSFLRLSSSRWPGSQDFATPPANDDEVQDEYQTLALSNIPQYTSPFRFRSVSRYTRLVRSTVYALKFIAHVATNTKATLRSFDVTPFNLTKDITASEFAVAEALLIKEHYRDGWTHSLPASHGTRIQFSIVSDSPRSISPFNDAYHQTYPFVPISLRDTRHYRYSSTLLPHSSHQEYRFKVLRLCVICKKINGLPYRYPDMPSLPPERVRRSRPFQNIGLDYFGPLRYKDTTTTSSKVWISLFTCMATRAIHLEIVMDNSTQEFLCALRRFIARRGVPTFILSDNATTFCAADNTLQELISTYSSSRHIQWKFITPLSPWKGGFYERLVGLVKSSFCKSIGRSLLPLSQFHTIICEIEAIINSRPIASISDTTSSPTILRPIDFISPQAHLQLELTDTTRYEQSQHQLDYLNAIAQRHTSRVRQERTTTREPRVGEVVLLADKQLPRGQWTPAVITYINYNHDHVPRSATIRLPNGNHVKRSINHLYPLELSAAESPSDTVIEKSTPPRIQPTRTAKSTHRYIKPRDTVQSNN
ncbi:hypothetical protein V3C99_018025 [Haemonchus contortus]